MLRVRECFPLQCTSTASEDSNVTLVFDYFASDRLDLESRFDMLSSRLVSVLAALPSLSSELMPECVCVCVTCHWEWVTSSIPSNRSSRI